MNQSYQNARNMDTDESAKTEGQFTHRIRSLASSSEDHEFRLRSLLRNLRVAPPEINAGSTVSAIHTTVEEQLTRHEGTLSNIADLLCELERLLA